MLTPRAPWPHSKKQPVPCHRSLSCPSPASWWRASGEVVEDFRPKLIFLCPEEVSGRSHLRGSGAEGRCFLSSNPQPFLLILQLPPQSLLGPLLGPHGPQRPRS